MDKLVLALPLVLAGCGDVSGDGDFPGAVEWKADDQSFRLRFLNPPWGEAPASPPVILRLVAELRGGAIGDAASDAPTHVLDITPSDAPDNQSACVAAETEATALGFTIRVAQRTAENLYGDTAHEFLSTDPLGLQHRDDFFSLGDGRVVRLAFSSVFDPDDPGIDLILDGFEPL
jgi:hypothetical protein